MSFIGRLVGVDEPKLPVHQAMAVMAEYARGRFTGAQCQAAFTFLSGPLDATEVTAAQELIGTVTGTGAQKLARATELSDVLMLAERGTPPYDTVAAVRTRLGLTAP